MKFFFREYALPLVLAPFLVPKKLLFFFIALPKVRKSARLFTGGIVCGVFASCHRAAFYHYDNVMVMR